MWTRSWTSLRNSAVAFPLAALAALAMFAISETSYQRATSELDQLGERSAARSRLDAVTQDLLDAETGERGYLLTGRPEYLKPYRDAADNMRRSLAWLRTHYASRTDTAGPMLALADAAERKLDELAQTIALRDQGRDDEWRQMLASESGTARMVDVRRQIDTLLVAENEDVMSGRRAIYQTLMLNRIGVSAMAALSLLALFMYLRQSSALDRATVAESTRMSGERDRLEAEVAARTAELRELARHLQTVREDERSLLARELHDELGALLTAAKLDAARLKSRLGQSMPEALERLQHLNDTLNGGIALKRRIIEDLRPSSLSNLGLVAALEILLREFGDRSELDVEGKLDTVELTSARQLTVYRLVQEALTNIAKYAEATRVDVTLSQDGAGSVHVTVRDDGVGFDSRATTTTHGLVGMRFRVEAEGGTMRIESSPGDGTRIDAILPSGSDRSDARAGVQGTARLP